MADQQIFDEKIAELKNELSELSDTFSETSIEETAVRLEKLNYSPPVIVPLKTFLRLNSKALLIEIDKILAMPDQEACELAPDNPAECRDLRIQFISVLLFYYKNLVSLRLGDIEAWDEVDEVYVHD